MFGLEYLFIPLDPVFKIVGSSLLFFPFRSLIDKYIFRGMLNTKAYSFDLIKQVRLQRNLKRRAKLNMIKEINSERRINEKKMNKRFKKLKL